MKKLLGLMIAVASSGSAFAVDTGVLELEGEVLAQFDIVVNDAPAATALNIVSGATDLQVATVDESANAAYKITMFSDNAGNLKNGATSVAYTLKYDGGIATPPPASGSPAQVKTGSGGTDNSIVLLNFAGLASAPAGTYTDNVTFTIAAQ